jgi:GTP-binding protein HflX
MIELAKETERVILVGVCVSEQDDTMNSLDELKDLADTAGAETVGRLIQNREQIHPGTYIGKGKIEELKDLLWELEATGIICDDELSPVQMKNLQDELDAKVMDRTLVILDIFAARASTSEGKIQVELAQLKYRQTRLTGFGTAMSRLGGGIGTRGPGEKKLEMDRRLIKSRIAQLNRELKDVRRHREVTRDQRSKSRTPVAAIVGYTNAGKSTLLNVLTGADILAEDKLFATLDPTTRVRKLPSGQEILLTDTVGFIRKLPHHLIEAFKSTLEEARYADLILHVADVSNPRMDEQMYTVYETLKSLDVMDKPVVTVFNKQDKLSGDAGVIRDLRADYTVKLSAGTKEGIPELLKTIEAVLRERKILIERLYSYQEAGKLQLIRRQGELLEEDYREDGIFVRAYVPAEIYEKTAPIKKDDKPEYPLETL